MRILSMTRTALHGALLLLAVGTAGCASTAQSSSASPASPVKCTVRSLQALADEPLRYVHGTFCGDVFAVRKERTVWLFRNAGDQPSFDLAMLVTTRSSKLLGRLTKAPRSYYIEANVDMMTECFAPVTGEDDEDCSPYKRPIFFDINKATPKDH